MVKKKKLALFLNTVSFGGVEKHVGEIAAGVDPEKFESFLICPHELEPHYRSMSGSDRYAICPVTQIQGVNLRSFMDFIRLLQKIRPDILHCHLYNATRVGAPAAAITGIPAVVETGHLVERWRTGLKKKISHKIDTVISNMIDQMIAVSTPVAEHFIKQKKYPVHKVTTIHNWCDMTSFAPGCISLQRRQKLKKEFQLPEGSIVLGIIGRLEEQKGHKYLFEVLPGIIKQFPHIHILVIGEGSLEIFLKEKAGKDKIQNNVHFLGFRKDIPELLSILDILLLPSLFEGMPLTLIEGAAMGIPSIASKVDGSADVIQDGKSGFLIPPADTKALKESMIRLIASPDLRKTMSSNAMEFAKDNFDMKKQLNKLENVYRSTLENKN